MDLNINLGLDLIVWAPPLSNLNLVVGITRSGIKRNDFLCLIRRAVVLFSINLED